MILALTLGTGAVDAVSYRSLEHVFTANMSGNIALMGVGLATDVGDVVGNALALGGFVAGAIVTARLVRVHPGRSIEVARDALLLELLLLVGVTLLVARVDIAAHDPWRYLATWLLAVAMGIQTGISRHVAVKDLNSTVATMTLHDLAAASALAGGDSTRWRRRAVAVLALLVGGALGVWLDGFVRWGGLALACSIVAAVTAVAAWSSMAQGGVRRARWKP